ncbi:hypothetical protein YC2023_051135 [Brassica napus]
MSPVTSLILGSPLAVALPSPFLPSLLNGSRASAKHLRLPPVKLHYSMLAEDAIKSAVKNYKKNKAFSDPAVLGWCHYGRFPRVETIGEIEKKELASIGDLHTYLSKLTDKDPGKLDPASIGVWLYQRKIDEWKFLRTGKCILLGSCSDYGLYTDFEKMAGIQKKEGVDCRSSHLHIQGQ